MPSLPPPGEDMCFMCEAVAPLPGPFNMTGLPLCKAQRGRLPPPPPPGAAMLPPPTGPGTANDGGGGGGVSPAPAFAAFRALKSRRRRQQPSSSPEPEPEPAGEEAAEYPATALDGGLQPSPPPPALAVGDDLGYLLEVMGALDADPLIDEVAVVADVSEFGGEASRGFVVVEHKLALARRALPKLRLAGLQLLTTAAHGGGGGGTPPSRPGRLDGLDAATRTHHATRGVLLANTDHYRWVGGAVASPRRRRRHVCRGSHGPPDTG
eukprot:COSAG01_NODE_24_length_37608_cov_19.303154_27_plen_266_part_00